MWRAIELRVRLRRCNRPAVQTKTAIHQVSHSFIQKTRTQNTGVSCNFVLLKEKVDEHLSQDSCGLSDCTCTHLALVDGDGPGQFEWQLLSTQVDPPAGLKHPALRLQHLCDAAQETHTGES